MSNSKWLKEYHSRIIEEYKFSMERKDRVTDWAIGIFFIALVAYAELLRESTPPIWRIYLIVGLLCFNVRLFFNSCLAYAYLKKWRYLLDMIEKHWMNNKPSLDVVKDKIKKLHYTPRTTEKRRHFVKSQLLAGFLLLFLFPLFLISFEIYFKLQNLNELIVPISFLFGYFVYELVMFITHKPLTMPKARKKIKQALLQRVRSKRGKLAKIIIIIALVSISLFLVFAYVLPWCTMRIHIENVKSEYLKIMENINQTETKDRLRSFFDRNYNYTELLTWVHGKLNFSWEEIERHQDPFEILDYGKGRCGEFSILYVSACLAHGYCIRLVADIFDDHTWAEIRLSGNWVHVDPSERKVNDPYMYERDWGKNLKVVYAFEDGSFGDVTSNYKMSR